MNKRQAGISLSVALGGLMFGFDVGIIGGAVPFIENYFRLNALELGWATGSLLAGAIPGAAAAGWLADRIGRRKALLCIALLFGVSSAATGLAFGFISFIIFRFVGGMAVGAVSVISPMYLSETAPAHQRGQLVSLYQLAITIGIVLAYLMNYLLYGTGDWNWRWMFISGTIPAIIFGICLLFIPESPRWLVMKKRFSEARQVLQSLFPAADALPELEAVSQTTPDTQLRSINWKQADEQKILFTGMVLALLVQFSGINTIVDYAPKILQSADWNLDGALFSTFGIGLCFVVFTLLGVMIIDRVGRRRLYLTGSAGMAVALLCLTWLQYTGQFSGQWVLLILLVYIAFFSTCIGTAFWTLVAEIYPTAYRGQAMSLTSLTNWTANFLVVFFFPWLLLKLGGTRTFGFLFVMSLTQFVFAFFFLKETKGKSLEEIHFAGH